MCPLIHTHIHTHTPNSISSDCTQIVPLYIVIILENGNVYPKAGRGNGSGGGRRWLGR